MYVGQRWVGFLDSDPVRPARAFADPPPGSQRVCLPQACVAMVIQVNRAYWSGVGGDGSRWCPVAGSGPRTPPDRRRVFNGGLRSAALRPPRGRGRDSQDDDRPASVVAGRGRRLDRGVGPRLGFTGGAAVSGLAAGPWRCGAPSTAPAARPPAYLWWPGSGTSFPNLPPRKSRTLPFRRTTRPGHVRILHHAVVLHALDTATATCPLALVLDDLHAAEVSTIELAILACRNPVRGRLLVLTTTRPIPDWIPSGGLDR